MATTTGWAWEVKLNERGDYSVRHRTERGIWETPSCGGWNGYDGALHALFSSGTSETTAKEMLTLVVPGKLVRLENCEIKVLDLRG